MRTTVITPSRSEGDVVVEVASAARACCDEVIVVDGHSTDGSPERLRNAGLTVIEDGGLGKGDAIRRGLDAASGDIVVTMDADGSHNPGIGTRSRECAASSSYPPAPRPELGVGANGAQTPDWAV
jgi:glycosyltransferase involved in cell wall biosynthesis